MELAFEDHRYWDLLRWKDAMEVLNKAIKGTSVRKNELGGFQYTYPTVAYRTFYERNYYFPFTRKEIANSAGAITQNPEYN